MSGASARHAIPLPLTTALLECTALPGNSWVSSTPAAKPSSEGKVSFPSKEGSKEQTAPFSPPLCNITSLQIPPAPQFPTWSGQCLLCFLALEFSPHTSSLMVVLFFSFACMPLLFCSLFSPFALSFSELKGLTEQDSWRVVPMKQQNPN